MLHYLVTEASMRACVQESDTESTMWNVQEEARVHAGEGQTVEEENGLELQEVGLWVGPDWGRAKKSALEPAVLLGNGSGA